MRSFEAMGTRFECVLAAFDRPVRATEAAAIAEEVEYLVRDWHQRLTVFDPVSPVSVVNALAAERPVSVDPELFALLDRCLSHTRDTNARFDIAVGSLMRAHGFRSPWPGSPSRDSPEPAWGSDLIVLDPAACTVRFRSPGVSIDLGAIAKGFVLDLARADLNEFGVTHALIHGGTSSVLAIGPRPDASPWRVRLLADDPDSPVVDLVDTALSVSAPSGRTVNGRGHIMDPATGRPSDAASAACVIGPSAEVCEAWSTALVVDPSMTDRLPEGYGCHLRTGPAWLSYETASVCSPGPR
jgi:thiamine biosynthesis lipoprotein